MKEYFKDFAGFLTNIAFVLINNNILMLAAFLKASVSYFV